MGVALLVGSLFMLMIGVEVSPGRHGRSGTMPGRCERTESAQCSFIEILPNLIMYTLNA